MGLVLYALKYRITFYVLAVLMLLGGIGRSSSRRRTCCPSSTSRSS